MFLFPKMSGQPSQTNVTHIDPSLLNVSSTIGADHKDQVCNVFWDEGSRLTVAGLEHESKRCPMVPDPSSDRSLDVGEQDHRHSGGISEAFQPQPLQPNHKGFMLDGGHVGGSAGGCGAVHERIGITNQHHCEPDDISQPQRSATLRRGRQSG